MRICRAPIGPCFDHLTSKEYLMKPLLLSAVAMAVLLSACGKEPAPPAKPAPVAPPPQAAPATPPAPAPSGTMTQEEKERAAKQVIDEAKKAARQGG